MKVAIVHDWLVQYGGAERVVEDFLAMYPDATIYTLVYDKKRMPERFQHYHIVTTGMQKWPFATKLYKNFLIFMPKQFEALDLSSYDLVISSCSSCCKGVLTNVTTPHICYCHTPTRYVWDMYQQYLSHAGFLKKLFMPSMIHKMRLWDRVAADRVDYFVSNSYYIRKRIKKYYHRDAVTIYPGVKLNPKPALDKADDYYIIVSRFVYYKRIDLAIEACNKLQKRLVIIGSGDESKMLKKLAGPTIEFNGSLTDDEVQESFLHAKAFLFPGEEDFGSTPVEAQSAGVPVLAYGKGGARETVISGKTGLFFEEQTVDSLVDCINKFEKDGVSYSRKEIQQYSQKFSQNNFHKNFMAYVDQCMKEWKEE
jgi:glycosyltransferase involved in cell wall biosynthesis